MRKRTLLLSLFLSLAIPAAMLPQNAQSVQASPAATGTRYVVVYDHDTTANGTVVAQVNQAGGIVQNNHDEIGTMIVDSSNPNFATEVAHIPGLQVSQDLTANWLPEGETAVNAIPVNAPTAEIQGAPQSAVFLPIQWNIPVTKTNLAWNITLGSPTVKVAVLDTGICAHQQDMVGRVRADLSASFISEPSACGPTVAPACVGCPPWEDRHFHGTHVGGTVASNNLGTASIAPNVELIAVKVLNCTGSGPFSAIINGIIHAANVKADVINMSLGGLFSKALLDNPGFVALIESLKRAIQHAEKNQGSLVVMSAGNNGGNFDVFPANKFIILPGQLFDDIPHDLGGMSVISTTIADKKSNFSNFGLSGGNISGPGGGQPTSPFPGTTANSNILAPCNAHSVIIPQCFTGNTYLFISGTSMAAPHISGAAALIASGLSTPPRGSYLAPQMIRQKLLNSVDDLGVKGADATFGAGRINMLKAVQ